MGLAIITEKFRNGVYQPTCANLIHLILYLHVLLCRFFWCSDPRDRNNKWNGWLFHISPLEQWFNYADHGHNILTCFETKKSFLLWSENLSYIKYFLPSFIPILKLSKRFHQILTIFPMIPKFLLFKSQIRLGPTLSNQIRDTPYLSSKIFPFLSYTIGL